MCRQIGALVTLVAAVGLSGEASATLIDRGGGLIYDTDLNITWYADANFAQTSGFDPDGLMTWSATGTWAAGLNLGGVTGWRLPTTLQPDPTCDQNGYHCTGSEMGHLYYNELGGTAGLDLSQFHNANYDLFQNFQRYYYWSATTDLTFSTNAFLFTPLSGGAQYPVDKGNELNALLVHDGDVALAGPDSDGDGFVDGSDNCTQVANANQRDTDADGYGNLCDPDFNGDGTVNINDFNRLKARLGIIPVVDVDTDLDGNGAVNVNDLNRLKSFLTKPPGPSGLHPNCPPTCP